MTRSTAIWAVLLVAGPLSACGPQPSDNDGASSATTTSSTTTSSTTTTTVLGVGLPCEVIYDPDHEWWAAGDSVFAGVGWQHRGAPLHIDGLYDRSFAGDTLVKVPQLPSQPTVRSRLQLIFCNNGRIPRRLVIQAGAADLFARATWQFRPEPTAYTDAITALDTWLKGMGVQQVVWTTIIPTTYWSVHASQNPVRVDLNEWMTAGELDVVDCNAELTDANGWLRPDLALGNQIWPPDGAHLNRAGARVHAGCIVEQLGDPGLTLRVE